MFSLVPCSFVKLQSLSYSLVMHFLFYFVLTSCLSFQTLPPPFVFFPPSSASALPLKVSPVPTYLMYK